MIKILELESSLGFGGQEHRTLRVINGLNKNKFKVYYGLNKGSKSFHKNINCEFVEFNLKKVYNIFEIIKICRFIKQNKIDIISTHSGKDGIIGSIVGKICKIKVVRTRHLQTPISSPFSYNLSSKVIAVSGAVKNTLIKQGVKSKIIDVIYTGVDTNRYSPNFTKNLKHELGLNKDTVLIGIVAVLRAAKNHELLINAFNELSIPNTALVIIGEGPQGQNLKLLTKECKNIFMLGNRTDINEFIGSLDIFVLPSKMEALGTAILEASSAGVACIGSDIGGIPEAIKHDFTGLIFKNNDKQDLKQKLIKIITDKSLREHLGENARNYVKDNFSIDSMVAHTEKMYEELV